MVVMAKWGAGHDWCFHLVLGDWWRRPNIVHQVQQIEARMRWPMVEVIQPKLGYGKKQRVHGPTRPIYEYLHYNKYEWDQEREGQKTVESEDREATSSSRSWTANRSEDDARDRNPREYEIVMRADVSPEQTSHLAQDLANQHGRDLVIELQTEMMEQTPVEEPMENLKVKTTRVAVKRLWLPGGKWFLEHWWWEGLNCTNDGRCKELIVQRRATRAEEVVTMKKQNLSEPRSIA